MTIQLRAGVGDGRPNHPQDVALVQLFLNGAPAAGINADGVWGGQTRTALENFQMAQFGFSDHVVDPGDITFNRLRGPASPPAEDALLRILTLHVVGELTDVQGVAPVSSRPTADGVGVVTEWDAGGGTVSVYSHPTFGTWEVYGLIGAEYDTQGADGGSFGNPISGERNLEPGPGRVSWFEHGRIEYRAATGQVVLIPAP
jgi:hypothetical protein